jgi:HAE1 family hydrophobic/amphiphilic exporter-1
VDLLRDEAIRYGTTAAAVSNAVEQGMRGELATEFVAFDRKIPIWVRIPDELRYDVATLERLRVGDVPLGELIDVRLVAGPAEIRREDRARVVTVLADVDAGGLDAAIEEVEAAVAAVPLALIGAVLALFLTGQGLNTMSLIGVVILIGIVVNDAIVKVDFIVQARARGASVRDAILEAGRVRLRPIVMTTATTVLGLLPMALGMGRGADLRAPLAIAVIGGLVVATALTLIVVPVVYQTVERTRQRLTAVVATPTPATAD